MATKIFKYTVIGKLPFPLDMLRHDACYPAASEDAARVGYTMEPRYAVRKTSDPAEVPTVPPRETYEITLIGRCRPTEGRWSSFGWSVDPNSVKPY